MVFLGLFFTLDFAIYKYYAAIYYNDHPKSSPIQRFKYMPNHPSYYNNIANFFNGGNNIYEGRAPVGLEYKSSPIVIFGCSYAYGQYLEPNQTFDYKLSHLTKRPVYNRALPGNGLPLMYYQSQDKSLYTQIKPPEHIIYVMIKHHYYRSMLYYFDIVDIFDLLHYHLKNNNLEFDDYDNKFFNFFKSLYISKVLNHIYTDRFINNIKNKDKVLDLTEKYFVESRKEFETNWNKKINFTVILYDDYNIYYKNDLKKRLKNKGFNVIDTDELTNENLRCEKYVMTENHHPNEKAWDLITTKIVEKLNL